MIGITIACALLSKGHRITIVAREFPSDQNSEQWSSPWAGAIWYPFENDWCEKNAQSRLEKETFEIWQRMKGNKNVQTDYLPKEVQNNLPLFGDSILAYVRTKRVTEEGNERNLNIPWWKDLVMNFSHHGRFQEFTSLSLHPTKYLESLLKHYQCDRLHLHRGTISSLFRAKEQFLSKADLIINASGLGSRYLADVNDQFVVPIRGQTIVLSKHISNLDKTSKDQINCLFVERSSSDDEMIYMISRAHSDQILLGGSAECGSFNTQPNQIQIKRILQDAQRFANHLGPDYENSILTPSILHTGVGLRPGRIGEFRLDWQEEKKDFDGKQFLPPVIHAYGFGKTGFQVSWGVAIKVLRMLEEHAKPL